MSRRVVVTGMSAITPIGIGWEEIGPALKEGRSGVVAVDEWSDVEGLATNLAAPVSSFERPRHYSRKKIRTCGRVALMSIRSAELALEQAGLLGNDAMLRSGRMGISFGSTSGSLEASQTYMNRIGVDRTTEGINGSLYVKMMAHSCAANMGQFFGINGRMIASCTACTSGSQGIGFGYEAIKSGAQDVMLCGGADELHLLEVVVFDVLYATSREASSSTPRPFDKSRDGLVVGEGAASLVLESLESAQARGAHIHGEIVGFGTNSDGIHMVNPDKDGMRQVMEQALKVADLSADVVDFVSAHGTATPVGDVAETNATRECFGKKVPIASLKGHMGHTLGACGAIEAVVGLHQMNEGWVAPTLNLNEIDPDCGDLDYVRQPRELHQDVVMSNNFAFGGVNTSLIFRRWEQ